MAGPTDPLQNLIVRKSAVKINQWLAEPLLRLGIALCPLGNGQIPVLALLLIISLGLVVAVTSGIMPRQEKTSSHPR